MAQTDLYESNNSTQLDAPARAHFAITPSNDNDLAIRPRALFCTAAGNVAVRMGGVDITYPVAVGDILPVRAERVLATGTTATVVGWY